MSDPKHVSPLSDFLRDHAALLDRRRQTRLPELITIDGKPEFVIQDAESYQQLVELADQFDSRNKIGAAIERMHAGVPGIPVTQALADIRRRIDAIKK